MMAPELVAGKVIRRHLLGPHVSVDGKVLTIPDATPVRWVYRTLVGAARPLEELYWVQRYPESRHLYLQPFTSGCAWQIPAHTTLADTKWKWQW